MIVYNNSFLSALNAIVQMLQKLQNLSHFLTIYKKEDFLIRVKHLINTKKICNKNKICYFRPKNSTFIPEKAGNVYFLQFLDIFL